MFRTPIFAAVALVAAPALAQTAAPAAVAAAPLASPRSPFLVVDIDRVITESAAGKFASAQLRPQAEQIQARVRALRTQFDTEGQALRQGVANASVAQDVAETRARDLQQRAQTAQQEVDGRQRQLQANQNYVLQQINDAMNPVVSALLRERGALIAFPRAAVLQHAGAVDATADVIVRLDKALPRVNTTAPAQPAAAPAAATPPKK